MTTTLRWAKSAQFYRVIIQLKKSHFNLNQILVFVT